MALGGQPFHWKQLTMYTVVRFEAAKKHARLLQALGGSLNRIQKNTFEGLDKVPGRFSCSVCDDKTWVKHVAKINRFVTRFSSVIRKARRNGVSVEFDIAIEPEDIGNRSYLVAELPAELIRTLAQAKIKITFTYYAGVTRPE